MREEKNQRKSVIFNTKLFLLAVIISVGFRVFAFLDPQQQQVFLLDLPILSLLHLKVPFFSIIYTIGLNVLLAFCFVFLFQYNTTKYSLLRIRSLFPFFFALILSNLNPNISDTNLNYILSLGLMFVYFRLFDCYELENLQLKVFDLSVCMGFLCLLDIRLVCLMPVFWYVLFSYRALTAKVFMASLFGLSTAFGALLIYLIFTGKEFASIFPIFREITEIDRQFFSPRTIARMVYLGTIFVTCFISYLNLRKNADGVRIRVIMGSLRVALICTNMLSACLFPSSDLMLAATIVPMALLLGYLFSSISGWFYRILFFLFTAAVITNFAFLLWKY